MVGNTLGRGSVLLFPRAHPCHYHQSMRKRRRKSWMRWRRSGATKRMGKQQVLLEPPRAELLWGPWEVLSMVCSSCR